MESIGIAYDKKRQSCAIWLRNNTKTKYNDTISNEEILKTVRKKTILRKLHNEKKGSAINTYGKTQRIVRSYIIKVKRHLRSRIGKK